MKIWLKYKVAMIFWINIYGCQPYPRHGHLISSKTKAIVRDCTKLQIRFECFLRYHNICLIFIKKRIYLSFSFATNSASFWSRIVQISHSPVLSFIIRQIIWRIWTVILINLGIFWSSCWTSTWSPENFKEIIKFSIRDMEAERYKDK